MDTRDVAEIIYRYIPIHLFRVIRDENIFVSRRGDSREQFITLSQWMIHYMFLPSVAACAQSHHSWPPARYRLGSKIVRFQWCRGWSESFDPAVPA